MKEYTYQGREIDHFTITEVPFSLLKDIIENESESDNEEAQELVNEVEEELTRRCELLDMNWELLNNQLEIQF